MNIEVLGGKDEIGGNKIVVAHDGTKVLLDFGMSFKQNGKFFSEFLQPRKCASLQDFFELELLPDLPGLYREDYLEHMGRPKEDREFDAVFLSHAHADHAQYIHFLRFDIPVYCSQVTKIILGCIEKTGSNPLSDLVTACEAFTFYKNKKGTLSRVTRKNTDYVHDRDFRVMTPEVKEKIGCLEVEMVPVDHSLPGAAGYIIYSDEGNLVYTGDIRFHGSNRALSMRFVEKAASVDPKWMLSEGTRIDSESKDSEDGVKKRISDLISKAKGLVFVEHPIRDLDRVNSIFESAKANNRKFVVNLKLAYILDSLGDLGPFSLDDVKILIPKKSWGLICKDCAEPKQIERDYATWEREFITRDNALLARDLSKKPDEYVVSMNMWEINQLTDIQPKDAVWIKSSCEPFCDEMELDEERKKNWLNRFQIMEHHAHASGHASGNEIKLMISRIHPEILIPIHTEHPELFK